MHQIVNIICDYVNNKMRLKELKYSPTNDITLVRKAIYEKKIVGTYRPTPFILLSRTLGSVGSTSLKEAI